MRALIPPADTPQRIGIALSGGVDSAATAFLLKQAGHQVFGLTMALLEADGGAAAADAARVAAALGIEHHVLDFRDAFRADVLQPFADAYAAGLTPLPCALCNRHVKMGRLVSAALDLGADLVATGHYARLVETAAGRELHRAVDLSRDQSYFLFAVPRTIFPKLLFPLGAVESKAETRRIAAGAGLPVSAKPDSQDLCFTAGGDHTDVVLALRPDARAEGDIVNAAGQVLGRHHGLVHYTIGQRRGLGLGGGAEDPVYVTGLRPGDGGGQVVVGPRQALERRDFPVREINRLVPGMGGAASPLRVRVKIRNLSPLLPGWVDLDPATGRGMVRLEESACGVAPGQAAVFYDPDTPSRVLGGGWIDREP